MRRVAVIARDFSSANPVRLNKALCWRAARSFSQARAPRAFWNQAGNHSPLSSRDAEFKGRGNVCGRALVPTQQSGRHAWHAAVRVRAGSRRLV